MFRSQIDEIKEKYGGIDGVREAVRVAKMKEKSVGSLIEKLDNILKSTENNLHCLKCWNTMTDPVVIAPCAHAFCNSCVKVGEKCESCDLPVKLKMPSNLLTDLTDKFAFNRDALDAFKNENLWK